MVVHGIIGMDAIAQFPLPSSHTHQLVKPLVLFSCPIIRKNPPKTSTTDSGKKMLSRCFWKHCHHPQIIPWDFPLESAPLIMNRVTSSLRFVSAGHEIVGRNMQKASAGSCQNNPVHHSFSDVYFRVWRYVNIKEYCLLEAIRSSY